MATRNEYIPKRAVHPGEYLNEELKAREIQKKVFAQKIGIPQSNLSEYLNGKRNFTSEFCVKLENALTGITAEEWMKIQTHYEVTKVKIESLQEEEQEACLKEQAMNELINVQKLLSRCGETFYNAKERVQYVYKILKEIELNDLTDIGIKVQGAFKGSDKREVSERNQRTWILLARIASYKEVEGLPEYNDELGLAFAKTIAQKVNNNTLNPNQIREIAREHGIGYARVEKLNQVPVDAYSTWVGSNPVIIPTYRYNDFHKLIFDILHEVGHIVLHKGKTFIALDDNEYNKQCGVEQEANKFAEDQLIPPAIWDEICSTQSTIGKTSKTICQEAKRKGINCNIALNRYSKESNNYRFKSERVKIF